MLACSKSCTLYQGEGDERSNGTNDADETICAWMTCRGRGRVVRLTRAMQYVNNTELSSPEGTRSEFNPSKTVIKLGIDVHQDFYVVVIQAGGSNPKPAQRFQKEAFLHWATKLKQRSGAEMYAVYEACGFGFGLQRRLMALGIQCHVVCPQKLDERNKRVKTDGLDAKALCLKLDRFVKATPMRSPWCVCPLRKRNSSGPFTGSASNWSKRANNWKPKGAA
jgi:hypothetical protein